MYRNDAEWIGELDRHLIGEGRHERLWQVLGAHASPAGVSFAVWAPAAREVRVCGDFDGWSAGLPLRREPGIGVWHGIVAGARPGHRYRYRILGEDGQWRDKADPMAFRTETPPATASVVSSCAYDWTDSAWLSLRDKVGWADQQVSIYEVHLGSWAHDSDYRRLAPVLADYVQRLGFTHVELMPVAEHPYGGSWGYQITSYYAPTARFGDPDDFRYLVDYLHSRGIGVVLDWVPAHFPKDGWALGRFDGAAVYEHADPRRGEHPDWGTYVFDHGRDEVRNFLVANALYWIEEFHVDGLRVDAVSSMLYLDYSRAPGEWLPNPHGGNENLDAVTFLQELTSTVGKHHPNVMMIAEESTAWPGVTRRTDAEGLGFGLKWNMGWMHDTLDYLRHDPIERAAHHHRVTFSATYAWNENHLLALSHDEVVHGKGSLWTKMPGSPEAKAATLRALYGYMWAHPGKQLLFMGNEFGHRREWADHRVLDWDLLAIPVHAGLRRLVAELNRLQRENPALYCMDHDPRGFSWLNADDAEHNVLTFLRHGKDGSTVACVANFAGVAHPSYPVDLPGTWRVILNTDAVEFGGSTVTADVLKTGRLCLPPSSVLWLAPAER